MGSDARHANVTSSRDDEAVSTTARTSGAPSRTTATATGPDWPAPVAGVVATAAALGVSELLGGPAAGCDLARRGRRAGRRSTSSHPGAKDVVVSLFGTNDKLALEVLIVVVALLVGAVLGIVARRRFEVAAIVFVAFGVVGFLATFNDPLASPAVAAAAVAVSIGTGLWVLGWLLDRSLPAVVVATGTASPVAEMPDWSRRSFIVRAGAIGVGAVALGVVGRNLLERQRTPPVGAGPAVPPASVTVPGVGPDADLSPNIPGLTPIVVPNDRFYRIDTSLLTPSVDTASWSLRVHGLVDRETTLTWDQLIALPVFEQYVTISCVSNEVGGKLVGNAKWTGVRLREVLDIAGVQPAATQLVGRSVDGWTAGHADRVGHGSVARADDRAEDERRAAAADPRLPGPPDRARPVRLRVGDEVARPSSS